MCARLCVCVRLCMRVRACVRVCVRACMVQSVLTDVPVKVDGAHRGAMTVQVAVPDGPRYTTVDLCNQAHTYTPLEK